MTRWGRYIIDILLTEHYSVLCDDHSVCMYSQLPVLSLSLRAHQLRLMVLQQCKAVMTESEIG